MADPTDEQRDEHLAGAEEAAAREAAETTADGDATASKVRRPKARTSGTDKSTTSPSAASRLDRDAKPGSGAEHGRIKREPAASAATPVPAPATTPATTPGAPPTPTGGSGSEVTRIPAIGGEVVGSGHPSASATRITLNQGGLGRAQAEDISVTAGGIGLARADQVRVELGGIGLAIAGEVEVRQGGVQAIVAREVEVKQSFVQTIVAANVEIEEQTNVLLMVAGRVEGNVRTLFDWRGALAFGAAFGVIVGLLRRGR